MRSEYKKNTVINDPIYGFISISSPLIFELINHPYFQRLRRISQLGLTYLVYPGARHTRFEHALGAMHLMHMSIDVLINKGIHVTSEEKEAAIIAILLHDIGHGPFSHTLENTIIQHVHHEQISIMLMEKLNILFQGKLSLAIAVFKDEYPKRFLHQLVSSQLDMDRMDYLNRDSFFTGVSEGIVNYDRIINKLNVVDSELVVELKGIYSVEKFITARRLMYWQVYLHKTTVALDLLITHILKRAKDLSGKGKMIANSPLSIFLQKDISANTLWSDTLLFESFTLLDDIDILSAIKGWMFHEDIVLSTLSKNLMFRNIWRVEMQNEAFSDKKIEEYLYKTQEKYNVPKEDAMYLMGHGHITNNAYNMNLDNIKILFPNGDVKDIAQAADLLNISALANPVKKYFLCYAKDFA